jgi:GNAT superfamily N-acetyltransferase
MLATAMRSDCHTGRMPPDPAVQLRLAIPEDDAFIVEMARHASVIEDWPLPDVESDDVQSLLPIAGEMSIVAVDAAGRQVGAVWTFLNDPPLRTDLAGIPLPELCIAVVPDIRGRGVGSALLDALFAQCAGTETELCLNVHVRNPARKLYQRKGFEEIGQGRGLLGIAMQRGVRW